MVFDFLAKRERQFEKFPEFAQLVAMVPKTILITVDNFLQKCIGQGYDGFSTIAMEDSGVQYNFIEKH